MASDAPILDISISREPVPGRDEHEVLVRLSGELDVSSEVWLIDQVAASLADHRGAVRLDLSAVTFVDSSGLRALLLCRQHADSLDLPFDLTVVEGPVTRLLELSGLDTYFSFRPPRPAAQAG